MDSYVIHIYRRKIGDPEAIVGTVEIAGVDGKRTFKNLRQMCEILLAPSTRHQRRTRSLHPAKPGKRGDIP